MITFLQSSVVIQIVSGGLIIIICIVQLQISNTEYMPKLLKLVKSRQSNCNFFKWCSTFGPSCSAGHALQYTCSHLTATCT